MLYYIPITEMETPPSEQKIHHAYLSPADIFAAKFSTNASEASCAKATLGSILKPFWDFLLGLSVSIMQRVNLKTFNLYFFLNFTPGYWNSNLGKIFVYQLIHFIILI